MIFREEGEDAVEFVIDDSFNTGSALFLNLTRETSTLLASVERHFSSRRGDRIDVEFNPSSCNVYDRDSGNINRYFPPLQMIYLEKLVS